MSAADVPALAGIHHLKLPVTDLARSLAWYGGRPATTSRSSSSSRAR